MYNNAMTYNSRKAKDDVIIATSNILRETNYQNPYHLSDLHRL